MPISDEVRKQRNSVRANTLLPELKDICLAGLEKLEQAGWKPYIVQAHRTMEEQAALYAQGRESLEEVNKLRKIANLSPITEEGNIKVTNARAGASKHNYKKAFDIVSVQNGEINWNDKGFYNIAALIYEEMGLVWGGRWVKMIDFPHFELK